MDTVTPPPVAPAASFLQRIQARLGRHGAFWITGALIAIVLTLFVWLLFQPSGVKGSPGVLRVGQTAPNFSLMDSAGHRVTLAQYHGHAVLVNFWGTFCQPCQSETPLLQRTYLANKSQGLTILGVDQADPADSVAQFGKDYGLTYPLLPDVKQDVNHQYGVTALPVSYFIDGNGVIRYAVNGILQPDTLAAGLQAIGIK